MTLKCCNILITFCLCFTCYLSAQPSFVVSPEDGDYPPNTRICFDIVAEDFRNLIAFGFPVTWDTEVLTFREITNINAPGLGRKDFDISQVNNGEFSLDWSSPDGLPRDLSDGFVLFKVCFQTTATCGRSTTMQVDTTGLSEGERAYADFAFSINDEIVGVNVGFLEYPANINVTCDCTLAARIINSNPAASSEGIIDVCPGESLSVTGTAQNPTGGELTYTWDFGDGTAVATPSSSYIYSAPGLYNLSFSVADSFSNCFAEPQQRIVRVAPEPSVALNSDQSYCTNETFEIRRSDLTISAGEISEPSVEGELSSIVPEVSRVDDALPLPDGEGVAYQSILQVDAYADDALIEEASDIAKVCLNMEHSWARDLEIQLTCPNGETIVLHDFGGQTGRRIRLGEPNEGDDDMAIVGTGYNYCWTMDASTGTWLEYGADFDEETTLPAGDYQPYESFENLVGCPLNGEWQLEVEDFWREDNGFIFSWGIVFGNEYATERNTFSPAVEDFTWLNHPNAESVSADVISLRTNNAGTLEVPYQVTDELGCIHEGTLSVPVENSATCGDGEVDCPSGNVPTLRIPTDPQCAPNGTTYVVRINTEVRNVLTADAGIVAGGSGFLTVYNIPLGQDVTVTITNPEACSVSQTIPAPNCGGCPDIDAPQSLGNKNVCAGDDFPQLSVREGSASTVIRWYNAATGGSLLATGANYTPSQVGSFFAEAFDPNTNCRSSRTELRLGLRESPTASISGTTEICAGESTVLTASGGGTYAWSNFARSNKVGVRAGTYSVTVTATNGCQDVATVTVSEITGPPCIECPQKAPPQSTGNRTVCSDEPIPALSVTSAGVNLTSEIRWYTSATGGAPIATGLSYTPPSAGTYYAEIFDTSNNCPSPRRAITLTIINCLDGSGQAFGSSTNALQLVEVQPNPFQSATRLHFELLEADWVQLSVFDLSGKVLYQQQNHYESGLQAWTIEAAQLGKSGMYFYRLESSEQQLVGKLLLQE